MNPSALLCAFFGAIAPCAQGQDAEVLVHARAGARDAIDAEERIAVPLETAIAALPEVVSIETLCAREGCSISVRFRTGVSIAAARSALAEKLGGRGCELAMPREEARTIRVALAGGERSMLELAELASGARERIARIPGVEAIAIEGARLARVAVQVDDERLRARGLVLLDLESALRGCVARELGDLERLRVRGEIELRDVAVVRSDLEPARSQVRIDGEPGLVLLVQHAPGAARDPIERALDALLPEGLRRLARAPVRLAVEIHSSGELERTAAALETVERALAGLPALWRVTQAGLPLAEFAGIEPDPRRGRVELGLAATVPDAALEKLRSRVDELVPGAWFHLEPSASATHSIAVRGGAVEARAEVAHELRERVAALPCVAAVRLVGAERMPRWRAQVDAEAVARAEVAAEQVERTLALVLAPAPLGTIELGRPVPIFLLAPSEGPFERLNVRDARDALVPLTALCAFSRESEPRALLRRDRAPLVRIDVLLRPGFEAPAAIEELKRILGAGAGPEGVRAELLDARK